MKHYKILFSVVLFLSLFSCKKLIEIKETDFIGGDIALKTVANNEQGIIGAYAGLGTEMDILLNATFSDEVKKAEFYNAATTHEWQYTSTDITIRDNFTAFLYFYRTIDRVNRVLVALPKADSIKAGDEVLRRKLKGEALFLRAYCHFELYRYYCGNYDPAGLGLAYMETPSLEPTARIAMGPYFQKMNADIVEAKGLLPNDLVDVLRATKLAATGLQARVALYMKDWPNAITYSTEYIAGLPLSPRATFNGIWTDANSNEVAFKLKRSTGNRIGSLFRGTSSKAANGDTLIGTITWAPSDKLYNSFDQVNDIRFSSYLKNDPLLVKQGRNFKLIQKYAGTGYTSASENVNDGKVFRTGEMYLIRAEAKAENNDLAGAAADINALRTARITGYTNIAYASKDLAITDIMLERFKELAFEGNRFFDLKRKNLPVDRIASDAPSTSAATLAAGNFRFTLPIPNVEIKANKLMVQNPGYTN
ncbi:MAG: RagB/SusD family nutrient uptake outer membrane protein [Chitinophagaceae bacterium]